jgi:hypothetical protein
LAEFRATYCFEFPCCLCAELHGPVTEAAIYIAATGPYQNFWVTSCALDKCGYFGERINIADDHCI